MGECRKTSRAEEDLIELWLYTAENSVEAADRLLDRIGAAFDLLADYPALGRARPDLAPGLRYLVIGQHLVLYRQHESGVEIVRVVHGRRYVPDLI